MSYTFPSFPGVSTASKKTVTPYLIRTKFGNGYEQRAPNGLNYKRVTWSNFVWQGMTGTNLTTLLTFLSNMCDGSYGVFTDPEDGTTYKLILDGPYTITRTSGQVYTVEAPFQQVFDA